MSSLSKALISLEGARTALFLTNKELPRGLRLTSIPAFISLLRLSDAGAPPTQNKLLTHWVERYQVESRMAGYALLYRLKEEGFIELVAEKHCKRVRITVVGRTYLKTFDKHLRKRSK